MVVALLAAYLAGSTALLGFGLDSLVESLSGGIILWRFHRLEELTSAQEEKREQLARRGVGYTFFVLGAYVLYEALEKLFARETASPSALGIAVALASLIVMPALARYKWRLARALASRSLAADAQETLACAWLSLALLVGLVCNYYFRLWWLDPVTALAVVSFLVKEGVETLRGDDEEKSAEEGSR
jgi:cation diffusion facilitator family transporter